MSENTAIQPINNSIVMPAVNGQQALEAWKQYEELKSAIVDIKNDVQKIGDKDYLKKSYWRKIARFFNLSVEVVDERSESIGKTFVWHFTCKAIAPNGSFAIGTGSCDAFEKAVIKGGKYVQKGKVTKWGKNDKGKSYPMEFEWEDAQPNSLHNIRSTAETRAFNRAVSNLVGGGEVSAEEVAQGQVIEDHSSQPAPQTTEEAPKAEDVIALPPQKRCSQCGEISDLRQGKSNGRAWTGYFCSKMKSHVEWITD